MLKPARLLQRWIELLQGMVDDLPIAKARAAWEDIAAHYARPPRTYHNLDHVAACCDTLDLLAGAGARDEVEFAIFCHDAVYDPQRNDNEERSAETAIEIAKSLGVAEKQADEIARLIRATRHTAPPADEQEALLLDVDLAILGAPRAAYDNYTAAIRTEYAFVSDEQWRTGRGDFLRALLTRPNIFHTPLGRRYYEDAARANLGREIAALLA